MEVLVYFWAALALLCVTGIIIARLYLRSYRPNIATSYKREQEIEWHSDCGRTVISEYLHSFGIERRDMNGKLITGVSVSYDRINVLIRALERVKTHAGVEQE